VLVVAMERLVRNVNISTLVGGMLGLAAGIFTSWLMLMPIREFTGEWTAAAFFLLGSFLGYGGLLVGISKGSTFSVTGVARSISGHDEEEYLKLVDTSVIIDGRIADVCETGFIDGVFVIPQFILQELQHIADSPDSLKRARGRRGLDILNRMQKMPEINVRIVEDDFPKIKEVDAKLVALGKRMGAKVLTNDFNLNKVAELQGVQVLNVNELANAIKPVVLPGEPLKVFIIKEGKEQNQGVAYLEDGTMVVVDDGKKMIGKNINVTVTSVLQTTAGRMIFTKTKEQAEREAERAIRE
ncbi:hypothetical protein LCGC14_2483360, partial [marine sediment metagenome]